MDDVAKKKPTCVAAYQNEIQKQHLDGTAGKQNTASSSKSEYIIVLLFRATGFSL